MSSSATAQGYAVSKEWMVVIDHEGIIRYKKFNPDINEVSSTIDQLLATTALQDSPVTPERFILKQNYPNPFNPITRIKFAILRNEFVELTIYNSIGQKVSTLVNRRLGAGTYEVYWDASNVSSGIYFYRITAGDFQDWKKMMLLK